ncbi:hypothetical protein LINGRAHAP2_LOCUS36778 [Linum grandiflorum]
MFIVQLTIPIVKLLRIVDSDSKPALGYVHEGMRRVEDGVKTLCGNVEAEYKPYIDIIEARWDKHLNRDLILAAYFFNPALRYSAGFYNSRHVSNALFNIFENRAICSLSDSDKAIDEMGLYEKREGVFGRSLAQQGSQHQQPAAWWEWFGKETPIIQKLAIHIVSQTAASSGCERNWSVFDRIHTKKRNMLEHNRLSDLVFVNYNMRLQHR